ncbi:trace amine-associated receptor 13c-like [Anabas testudineus]|uniref:trace amine-associated receptor 13c-like n=1 Tax=Anabas testudineus TaxID=64144 RepID=UPI000E45E308|nr:trace amine-associated receptor 13c-like [Anabas testudineus]
MWLITSKSESVTGSSVSNTAKQGAQSDGSTAGAEMEALVATTFSSRKAKEAPSGYGGLLHPGGAEESRGEDAGESHHCLQQVSGRLRLGPGNARVNAVSSHHRLGSTRQAPASLRETQSGFRQLHTPTNLLLLSLAVSDFFVGLVVTPLEAHRQTSCWFLGNLMCSLYNFVAFAITCASVVNVLLISADRYVAICDPLHYPTRVTVRRVKVCVFLCWLCSVLYSTLFLKDDLTQPDTHNSCYGGCVIFIDYISGTVDIVLTFIVPIAVIIVLYLRVFLTAVSQARAMRSHVAATTLHHSGNVLSKKSELKAARTLGINIIVFLICFCPYHCLFLVQDSSVSSFSAAFAVFMLYISPCLNPVIYALFYPWFRKAIRLIISLQILQPGSCETNMLYVAMEH